MKLGVYYEPHRLREYAALSNSPIIYCLTYEVATHRIAGLWAHQWLTNFVNTVDPVAFHPHSLKLIRKNLPQWRNLLTDTDDYQLFLRGVIDKPSELDSLIRQAIEENRVLHLDKNRTPWIWELLNE